MAEISVEDIISLSNELQASTTGASSTHHAASSSGPEWGRMAFDPDSSVPVPLQVLRLVLSPASANARSNSATANDDSEQQHVQHLISVETSTGYAYQGTLVAVDMYYNMTLVDVTVTRRRVPRHDFDTASALRARGTPMGFLSSVCVKSCHVVFVELPEHWKSAFVAMARSVKKVLKAKRGLKKLSTAMPATNSAAADTSKIKKAAADRAPSKTSKPPATAVAGPPRAGTQRRSQAKKALFRKV